MELTFGVHFHDKTETVTALSFLKKYVKCHPFTIAFDMQDYTSHIIIIIT